MHRIIDLRSDTVTLPPPEMRDAIAHADLGDDGYGEDPTVNQLESLAAGEIGKDAAALVPSGTMANLLTILAQCSQRRRVLVGDLSDIWKWEACGASLLGGIAYDPVPTTSDGEVSIAVMEREFEEEDPSLVPIGLICLEDTHCLCGGRTLSIEYLSTVSALAQRCGIPVHLDGARLFNAAVGMRIHVSQIARFADSVSICLSKGLAAPAGSLIVGPASLITRIKTLRKMLGGTMRQAGIIAAAGIYALRNMVERLAEDHTMARMLAEGLNKIPEIQVDPQVPETNIVFFRLADPSLDTKCFIRVLDVQGVRIRELGRGRIRAVTHFGITPQDIKFAVETIGRAFRTLPRRSYPASTT